MMNLDFDLCIKDIKKDQLFYEISYSSKELYSALENAYFDKIKNMWCVRGKHILTDEIVEFGFNPNYAEYYHPKLQKYESKTCGCGLS